MKHFLLLSLLAATTATPLSFRTGQQEKPKEKPAAHVEDDDLDGQVVLANVANMLGCIGMLSTDPYNPAVAGPNLAQIGISFINIITQIFKAHGLDDEITRACVEHWFNALPEETKMDLIHLVLLYAEQIRHPYCPQCECENCLMHANECIGCRN